MATEHILDSGDRDFDYVVVNSVLGDRSFRAQISGLLKQGYVLYGSMNAVCCDGLRGKTIIYSQALVYPEFHPDNVIHRVKNGGNKLSKRRKSRNQHN
jgi:hypothetical protein